MVAGRHRKLGCLSVLTAVCADTCAMLPVVHYEIAESAHWLLIARCGPAIAFRAAGAGAQRRGHVVCLELACHQGAQRAQWLVRPEVLCLSVQMLPQWDQALLAVTAPA